MAPGNVHIARFEESPSNVIELHFALVSENSSKYFHSKITVSLPQKRLIKK